MVDGSGSDGESLTSSNGKRRFRRAANHIRIFSEGADYSHVRSKVNTGIAAKNSSLSPNSMQSRRNSRMSISSLSNEDLRKLKTTLAEVIQTLDSLSFKGNVPKTQRILLIETPATPIPEERTELITFVVQPSVSPVPPVPPKPNVDDMTSSGGLEPKSGKPAPKTQTQDRTNRKSSVGPGGAWLFDDQSESTTEKDKTSKKTGGLDDKSETFGDVNTTPSFKNSSEDRKASLTNVAVSLPQENDKSAPKNTDNGNARNEAEETSQDKVSSWLLGNDKKKDSAKNTTHEDEGNGKKMGDKGSKDNDSGTGMSLNHGGSGSDNTKVDEVNGKKDGW
ncbi:hypothetical protein OS493_015457 [Desmophyllum pertusum]|uniref:Uncharacterized protein n=1 Tax=Desmophyllum pertusum TaxID=174260 RepID=A0A9X0CR57_9CNID|nr:hypothetical protein OS493_015457 [Desmophyllum pertusum]